MIVAHASQILKTSKVDTTHQLRVGIVCEEALKYWQDVRGNVLRTSEEGDPVLTSAAIEEARANLVMLLDMFEAPKS